MWVLWCGSVCVCVIRPRHVCLSVCLTAYLALSAIAADLKLLKGLASMNPDVLCLPTKHRIKRKRNTRKNTEVKPCDARISAWC